MEAMLGDTVTFSCEYTGTNDLPNWRIGGIDYSVADLPPGHRYTFGGLQVQRIKASLNNTEYRCFFVTYSGGQFHRIESLPAYLVIRRIGTFDCMMCMLTLQSAKSCFDSEYMITCVVMTRCYVMVFYQNSRVH